MMNHAGQRPAIGDPKKKPQALDGKGDDDST
jgi:hypothetical protein